jgi:hypothetical protein
MAVVQVGGVWPGATLLLLLSNILPLLLLAPYTQAGPDGEDSAFDKVFPTLCRVFMSFVNKKLFFYKIPYSRT